MVMAARTAAKSMAGREESGCALHLLVACLTHLLAAFAGLGEFAVAFGVDVFVVAEELVLGSDVADGAVQANVVVMGHEIGNDVSSVVERERAL